MGLEENIGNFLLLGFAADGGERARSTRRFMRRIVRTHTLQWARSPREVSFRGRSADGLSMTQTLRFYPDSYRIDARIEVHNPKETPVDGSFRAELSALPPSAKGGYYSYVGLIALANDKLEEVELDEVERTSP